MQRLQAAGRFKARIIGHGVSPTQQKGVPQWVAQFAAFEQEGVLTDGSGNQLRDDTGRPKMGWVPLDDEYTTTAYLTLGYKDEKNNNALTFTNNCNNLMDALGWVPNMSDPWGSLQAMDLSQTNVQIVVQEEDYNGKPQYRVAFVNPVDFDGFGVKQSDQATLAKMNNEWASAFRAKFGQAQQSPAAPAPQMASKPPSASQPPQQASQPPQPKQQQPAATQAPAPVAGKPPTMSPPKPAASAPAPSGDPVPPPAPGQPYAGGECTAEDAWNAFAAQKGQLSDEGLSKEWFRILQEKFNASSDEEINGITPAQWAWVRDSAAPIPF